MDYSNPTISVITLTRNRAKILPRAVNSVLNQTYKNFEYIIIDGASTDGTEEVLRKYNDKRIKYIKQDVNLWPPLSIDQAFEIAEGQYITFLDDDDEYLPEKLEKQLAKIQNSPQNVGMVYCWMDYYDNNTNKLLRMNHETRSGNIYYDLIEKSCCGGTPTYLFKREAFAKVGGWSKTLKHLSDWEMICRFSQKYEIDVIPEVLVKVYINHGHLRQSDFVFDRKKILDRINFHNHFLTEFKDGFNLFPQKQVYHLISLMRYYSMLGELSKTFYYAFNILYLEPFSVHNYNKIIKSTIRSFGRKIVNNIH